MNYAVTSPHVINDVRFVGNFLSSLYNNYTFNSNSDTILNNTYYLKYPNDPKKKSLKRVPLCLSSRSSPRLH